MRGLITGLLLRLLIPEGWRQSCHLACSDGKRRHWGLDGWGLLIWWWWWLAWTGLWATLSVPRMRWITPSTSSRRGRCHAYGSSSPTATGNEGGRVIGWSRWIIIWLSKVAGGQPSVVLVLVRVWMCPPLYGNYGDTGRSRRKRAGPFPISRRGRVNRFRR